MCVALAAFAVAPALAQAPTPARGPYAFNRVGEAFDAAERAYFRLFPGVDGFVEARLHSQDSVRAVFAIERAGQPDSLVVVKAAAVPALDAYLRDFERVHDRVHEVPWAFIYPIARPLKRFGPGLPLVARLHDGRTVRGRLLYADERIVVLTQEQTEGAQLRDADADVLLRREIYHLRDVLPPHRRLFGEVNVLGAGNDGVYERHTLPLIRRRAISRHGPSPEVQGVISARLAEARRAASAGASSPIDPADLRRLLSRWHLSLRVHPLTPANGFDYAVQTASGSTVSGAGAFSRAPFSLALARSIGPRWWGGLAVQYTPTQGAGGPFAYEFGVSNRPEDRFRVLGINRAIRQQAGEATAGGLFVSPQVTVLLKPYGQFGYLRGQGLTRLAEVRASAGPSLGLVGHYSTLQTSWLDVDQRSGRFLRIEVEGVGQRTSQVLVGAEGGADLSLYVRRGLSFVFSGRARYYPSMTVPELVFTESRTGTVAKRRAEQASHVLMGEVQVGVEVHL